MSTDHINDIERKLIDNLRNGTYRTTAGATAGSAWSSTDVTVYGQFPITEDVKYPAIVVEQVANGIEQQFIGQSVTSGSSEAIGEIYGMGFNIHLAVDKTSSITVGGTPFKQRRLLNYLMLNCANVVMDCDFTSTACEVLTRGFTGFRDIGYDSERELWVSLSGMIVTFKNTR
tara:strand:- start:3145 stop:3663 length:519 start_codon:yes stop_codon:yes gene_type:complete